MHDSQNASAPMNSAGRGKPAGGRRPTMADVADRVGVSRTLVSLVFRNHAGASALTRERVFEAASDLGYRPDTAAQLLRSRRSRHLGVLYSPQQPFHADVIAAIYPVAERIGYGVVLGAMTHTRDVEKAVDELLGFRSEAIILVGPSATPTQLAALAGRVPVVTVGRHLSGKWCDSVRTDDARGARQAVDHLVERGHRRIVHIDGGSLPGAPDRRQGYRNAMRRHKLHDHIGIFSGDYSEESGVRAAHEILRRDPLPTAVFAANDRCAVGLLLAFLRMGVDVPRDISIVGFDDSRLARLPPIDLTTVRQDVAGMAEAMVETVIERLDDGRTQAEHVVLKPVLVVRSTTRCPPEPG
jgi:DNA-binding LacI/PurR family transcriptional regulator